MRRRDRLSTALLCAFPAYIAACTAHPRTESGLTDRPAGATNTTPANEQPQTPETVMTASIASPAVSPDPTSAGCVLEKAVTPVDVAFCETFDAPAPVITRSGQLDQTLWGVSRLNTHVNPPQGNLNNYFPTSVAGCGLAAPVMAPNDVRICNGRAHESANDMEGQSTVALYPKQPFDFTHRTGTVSFDVSLDSQGPHAAWPEFWITDKPIPAPSDGRSANYAYARHQFGITFGSKCGEGYTAVDRIATVRNYKLEHVAFTNRLRRKTVSALACVERRLLPRAVESQPSLHTNYPESRSDA